MTLTNGFAASIANSNTFDILNSTGTSGLGLSGGFADTFTDKSGAIRVLASDGISTLLLGINTTGAAATVDGLANVPACTVRLGGFLTNQWSAASGSNWSPAASWTVTTPDSNAFVAQFADGPTATGPQTVVLDVPTTVQGLVFNSTLRSYTISGSNTLTLDNTGNAAAATINVLSGVHAIQTPLALNGNLAVATGGAPNGLTISGPISGSGSALSVSGSGTLILTGANTYSGLTTASGATLQLGDGITDPSLLTSGISDNAVLLYDVRASQTTNYPISGSGALTKLGSGTLTLATASTYTGNTLISQGTLQLGNNLALQNSVLDTTGTGVLTCSASVNTPTFGGLTGANNLTLPSNVASLMLNLSPGVSETYCGALGGAAGLTLTKAGPGVEMFSGTNTYSGGTNVNGGTLDVLTPASLPNYAVAVAGGATLAVPTGNGTTNGWTIAQIGSLLTSASWASNTACLAIVTTNANLTYAGNITPALALTKAGAGTLTLTGANTYTGLTTVSGGTLQLGDGTTDPSLQTSGISDNAVLLYDVRRSDSQLYDRRHGRADEARHRHADSRCRQYLRGQYADQSRHAPTGE